MYSKLPDDSFDFVLDRGCFHLFEPSQRQKYVKQVKRILDKEGILFLKCFSIKETRDKGPYHFSKHEIKDIFSKDFVIESIKDTVYHGTLNPLPKALFVVMRKKSIKKVELEIKTGLFPLCNNFGLLLLLVASTPTRRYDFFTFFHSANFELDPRTKFGFQHNLT